MTDQLEAALEPIRAMLKKQEWFQNIAATIHVNALRHGANDAQIDGFINGGADFIGWMKRQIEGDMLAERDAAIERALKAEAENARLREERDRFEAALARACQVGGSTYLIERAEKAEADNARLREFFNAVKAFDGSAVSGQKIEQVNAAYAALAGTLLTPKHVADKIEPDPVAKESVRLCCYCKHLLGHRAASHCDLFQFGTLKRNRACCLGEKWEPRE